MYRCVTNVPWKICNINSSDFFETPCISVICQINTSTDFITGTYQHPVSQSNFTFSNTFSHFHSSIPKVSVTPRQSLVGFSSPCGPPEVPSARARLWPVCCAQANVHSTVQRLSMCPSNVYHYVGPVRPVVMGERSRGSRCEVVSRITGG